VSAGMVAYPFKRNIAVLTGVILKEGCYCTHSNDLGYSVAEEI
jgi:hypothetical protein